MRSFMVGTVVMVMLAIGTLAESSSAEEAIPTRPRILLGPQVRIAGFHRPPGPSAPYTGGALGVTVDVENPSGKAALGVVVKLDIGAQVLESTVSLAAGATRAVTFNDTEGLAASCQPKAYMITLAAPGMSAVTRKATITPSCTFKSTLEETWNLMSPDRVDALRTGNAYLSAPSIVTAPACGKGPTVKVRILNKAGVSSPSLIVQAKDFAASGKVRAQTAAAFPLAPNESKELLLTPVSLPANADVPARLKLGIVDWTKSLGGHTSDGGIFVNTTRSCALDFDLE